MPQARIGPIPFWQPAKMMKHLLATIFLLVGSWGAFAAEGDLAEYESLVTKPEDVYCIWKETFESSMDLLEKAIEDI